MKRFVMCAGTALLVSTAGCKKSDETTGEVKDKPATTEPARPDKPAEPEKPALETPEQKVTFYRACFGHLEAKDWDKFSTCYTEDAVSDSVDSGMPPAEGRAAVVEKVKGFVSAFPDMKINNTLVLTSGDKVASVGVFAGTNSGAMPTAMGEMPATNKNAAVHQFHMVELDPAKGGAAKEWLFTDMGTVMGQLGVNPQPHRPPAEMPSGEPTVVVASDSETEKANLALYKEGLEAFNKGDSKKLQAMWAPNAKIVDTAMPKDMTAKDSFKMMEQVKKAFPDAKAELVDAWAAGDYVVAVARNTGTNKGPMPAMGIKKATGKPIDFTVAEVIKFENGKAVESWSFYNGMAVAYQLGLLEPPPGGQAPAGGDAPAGGE